MLESQIPNILVDNLIKYNLSHDKIEEIDVFINQDLAKFIDTLIKLDKQILAIREKPDKDIQSKLNESINIILGKALKLEYLINDKLPLKYIKRYFREQIGFSSYQSILVQKAFKKPRGYPGDFELLELIYNNKPVSNNIGLYWDSFFLNDGLAKAVRDRKDKTVEFLKDYIQKNISKKKIRLLNLACGSSRELRELFENLHPKRKELLEFSCLDQEEDALKYSKSKLDVFNIKISYIKENILDLIKNKSSCNLKDQDIVYSIGLTDYLPDRILGKFLSHGYGLLTNGGKLFIAHKDHMVYNPIVQDWFCNWTFYPRTENQLLHIVNSFCDTRKALKSYRGIDNIINFIEIIK